MTDHSTAPGGVGTDDGTSHGFDLGMSGADARPCASYTLHVNGVDRPVPDAWIGESLLYVLRERLGLAGAKDGCQQGECGACSVQLDGQLVASCLVPAALAVGSEIRTVEALAADGAPSDVQQALAAAGAVQCGYCIPGLTMAVHDLLQRNHRPTDVEARQALSGNLCRCTGYRGVLEAVHRVAEARQAAAEAEQDAPAPGEQPPAAQAQAPAPEPPAGLAQAKQQQPAADADGLYLQETAAPEQPTEVDPLFGPLDAVLEAAAPQPDPSGVGYGTYAPDPYGTGVYAEQPYGPGAYGPDPYQQSHGADSAPVPALYTPDGLAAYDPAHGLAEQPRHGTPPHGTDLTGTGVPEFDPAEFHPEVHGGETPSPEDDRA